MRVGVTQNRFIGEGSFFRASSGIFLKAAWVLYSSEKGSTIAAMPVTCRLLRLPKPSYLSYTRILGNLESECETALQQIDDRMYAKEYEDDYDQILCYGISFFKKRCMVKKK